MPLTRRAAGRLGLLWGAGLWADTGGATIRMKCSADNDLYRAVRGSGSRVARYGSAAEAVAGAGRGDAVFILADAYPDRTEVVGEQVFAAARAKRSRVYVEYPAGLPRRAEHERGVVAGDAFGPSLARLSILALHRFSFVPVSPRPSHIVAARVAGFDTAVYGLPDRDVFPILFTDGDIMVATTKLSNFVTGRYGPAEAWTSIWSYILGWATESSPRRLAWTPAVRPSYRAGERIPTDHERRAIERAAAWYSNSRMLVHPSWAGELQRAGSFPDRVGPAPRLSWPAGDGTAGLLEGFASSIHVDGSQDVRWWLRADCMAEASFAVALAGAAHVAANLNDFVYAKSVLQQGARANPANPAFGLLGWNTTPKYWRDLDGFGVYYGDDNARAILATLGSAAVLGERRWDAAVARCIVGNFRTTGALGFRGSRIDQPDLERNGWRHYFTRSLTHFAPHYEAYLWAVNLWAYRASGYGPLLERTKTAVRMTMEAYPGDWQWTNGLQQERARMLLPLAWLVRVEDTPEHRGWLRRVASDVIAAQDACGAIREELGAAGKGDYGPPKSNEAYGTAEAPLLQRDGDPVTDLLYTADFAFLGLHEAAAATGERLYSRAEDALAQFLCRVQARSDTRPELDGAWFRAFDYRRWEYWASNADSGWGAWSVESGWSQAWITAALALRQRKTSFWALARASEVGRHISALIPTMLDGDSRRP